MRYCGVGNTSHYFVNQTLLIFHIKSLNEFIRDIVRYIITKINLYIKPILLLPIILSTLYCILKHQTNTLIQLNQDIFDTFDEFYIRNDVSLVEEKHFEKFIQFIFVQEDLKSFKNLILSLNHEIFVFFFLFDTLDFIFRFFKIRNLFTFLLMLMS